MTDIDGGMGPRRHSFKPTTTIRKKPEKKGPKTNPALEAPMRFMASSFGASMMVPMAPGTAGMVVGFGFWFLIGKLGLKAFPHFMLLAGFFGFGVWLTKAAEPYFGDSERNIISYDVMVGAMVAAAPFQPGFHKDWRLMLYVIAGVYWLLSLTKPPPLNMCEELPGGLKYMVDDLLAGIVTILITWGASDFWGNLLGLR